MTESATNHSVSAFVVSVAMRLPSKLGAKNPCPRSIRMSVMVVRAFVRMRHVLATHKELAQKLAELERRIGAHDEQIRVILQAIRQLMTPPEPKKRKIGFLVKERAARYGRG